MVRNRSKGKDPIEVRELSREAIDRGIEKIRRRIAAIMKLKDDRVPWDDGRKNAVEVNVRETVREIFGSQSPEFRDFEYFSINTGNFIGGSDYDYNQLFVNEGIPYSIALLEGLISRLEEKREDLPDLAKNDTANQVIQPSGTTRRVFLVHGHDEEAKQSVARFIEKLQLEPVILQEQPNEGRTIIEKFEKNADVEYEIILLTPDDVGYPKDKPNEAGSRARQNVILELGYFVGRLSRKRVCALCKGSVEIPSDYHGVLYLPMDDADGWKLKLAREIKQSGLSIDLNLAI